MDTTDAAVVDDVVVANHNNDENNKQSNNVQTITEGSSIMTYPSNQELSVFYNPVQVQNRDLSILMITLYAERRAIRKAVQQKKKELRQQQAEQQQTVGDNITPPKFKKLTKEERKKQEEQLLQQIQDYEQGLNGKELVQQQQQQQGTTTTTTTNTTMNQGLTILDALAASGLRSLRYWKEIPGVHHVTINDLEVAAIERAYDNIYHNQLQTHLLPPTTVGNGTREHGIYIQQCDATHELYRSRRPQSLRTTTTTTNTDTTTNTATNTINPNRPQILPVPPHVLQQTPMWDVIDLDPYGSAAPFIDGAVQSVEHGGMLCITCTDMAALGGSHPETAFGRYGGLPIQSAPYLQELAIRLLLHTIAISAAKYGRTIRPILSVGMDFYIRVFIEVYDDKKGVSELSLQIGQVYQSTQCPTFITIPHGMLGGKKHNVYQSSRITPSTCPETGSNFKVGGPLWLGPLHDPNVVQTALDRLLNDEDGHSGKDDKMKHTTTTTTTTSHPPQQLDIQLLATKERIIGLLSSVREEVIDGAPLYYTLPTLCKTLHITSPPLKEVMAAIHNAGYKVSGYHKEPVAIKTNAPSSVVWDVLRAWSKQHPPKKVPSEQSAAHKILSKESSIEIDFTIPKNFLRSRTGGDSYSGIARFPLNPTKFWGPKAKATNKTTTTTTNENSKRKHSEAETAIPPTGGGGDGDDNEEPSVKKLAAETTTNDKTE